MTQISLCLHCLKLPVWTHIHTSCVLILVILQYRNDLGIYITWKLNSLQVISTFFIFFNNLSLNVVEKKELIFSTRIQHLIRSKSQWIKTWCHGSYGKHRLYASFSFFFKWEIFSSNRENRNWNLACHLIAVRQQIALEHCGFGSSKGQQHPVVHQQEK